MEKEIPRATKLIVQSRAVGLHNVDYADDELEFMKAMDKYKRENRRPFPTCSEVLGVLKSLGYAKTKKGESKRSKQNGHGPSKRERGSKL